MKTKNNGSRGIKLLRDAVARKIAAGEVIERPASVVRELLDNAIDAEATEIHLHIKGGGINTIRVVDNGLGMSQADLAVCWLPHATSKIEEFEDLDRLFSLGFRGEALSSIAACSRLEIISAKESAQSAHRLTIHGGELIALEESQGNPGSVVSVSDLFYALPGRRKFLKQPAAETARCKATFLEKALPFPGIGFKLFVDGQMKLFLPSGSFKERVAAAFSQQFTPQLIKETSIAAAAFSITALVGIPDLSRKDRRFVQIYVNKRRVQEFALIQAVEYGYSSSMPGGTYPYAFVFIEIDPSLVDFNIHPAKKEVKIKNMADVHHKLVEMIQGFVREHSLNISHLAPQTYTNQELSFSREPALEKAKAFYAPGSTPPVHGHTFREEQVLYSPINLEKVKKSLGAADKQRGTDNLPGAAEPGDGLEKLKYLGQLFNLFLLVEYRETLFIIDQHAAHERILFDSFRNRSNTPQQLLVPIELEISQDKEALLEQRLQGFEELGIKIEKHAQNLWKITTMPELYAGHQDKLVDFIQTQKGSRENLGRELFADLACKAAIKDGEQLDEITATELAKNALRLPQARCPHGRPLWYPLSRKELFQLLGRS